MNVEWNLNATGPSRGRNPGAVTNSGLVFLSGVHFSHAPSLSLRSVWLPSLSKHWDFSFRMLCSGLSNNRTNKLTLYKTVWVIDSLGYVTSSWVDERLANLGFQNYKVERTSCNTRIIKYQYHDLHSGGILICCVGHCLLSQRKKLIVAWVFTKRQRKHGQL